MAEVPLTISDRGEGWLTITRQSNDGQADRPINLADPDVACNPYPVYRALREQQPIFRSEQLFGGAWVFLDYDDVAVLFRDTEHLSNAKSRAIIGDLPPEQQHEFEKLIHLHSRWMVFFDPPRHTRLRKLMAKGFSNRIRENLYPAIQEHVDELLDSFVGKERIDVVGDYAWQIPLMTIANIIGVTSRDLPLFARWTGDIAAYMGSEKPHLALIARAQQSLIDLEDYFRSVVAERRANPIPNDILSMLIAAEEDGDVLTEEELFAQCTFLCFTGNETTKNLISNAIYTLLSHPRQYQQLLEKPTLLRDALEEVLRFECPVQFIGRIVKEDWTYKSATMKKGEYIVLMIGAANRDPLKFADPEQLDISRKENRHISFGEGAHTCLGQGLARVEAEIAVASFLQRFPAATFDWESGLAWNNNPGLHGLEQLWVRLG